jgi:hypothetical protein
MTDLHVMGRAHPCSLWKPSSCPYMAVLLTYNAIYGTISARLVLNLRDELTRAML